MSHSEGESGLAITVGKIDIAERLKPGGSYSLPPIGVINTGQNTQKYEFTVDYVDGQKEKRPSPRWLEFSPREFTVDPGKSQTVDIQLTVPTGVSPGDYFAYLQAQTVDSSGGSVQAAVATKLTFTVIPSSWFDAQRTRLNRWLDDAQPWTTILPIALVAVALFRWSSRRVRFRLPFEPR